MKKNLATAGSILGVNDMVRLSDFEMIPKEKEMFEALCAKYDAIQKIMIRYHMQYDDACDFYDKIMDDSNWLKDGE